MGSLPSRSLLSISLSLFTQPAYRARSCAGHLADMDAFIKQSGLPVTAEGLEEIQLKEI